MDENIAILPFTKYCIHTTTYRNITREDNTTLKMHGKRMGGGRGVNSNPNAHEDVASFVWNTFQRKCYTFARITTEEQPNCGQHTNHLIYCLVCECSRVSSLNSGLRMCVSVSMRGRTEFADVCRSCVFHLHRNRWIFLVYDCARLSSSIHVRRMLFIFVLVPFS